MCLIIYICARNAKSKFNPHRKIQLSTAKSSVLNLKCFQLLFNFDLDFFFY